MENKMENTTEKTLWAMIKERLGTILITLIVGIATLFSNSIISRIDFSLNHRKLISDNYNTLIQDISDHIFNIEIIEEYFSKNLTGKTSLKFTIDPYNNSITKIRRNEYYNLTYLNKYCTKEEVAMFREVMKGIKEIDLLIHEFNEEGEKIMNDEIIKADEKFSKSIADKIKPKLTKLDDNINLFLEEYSKYNF
jgi:hypothetical protein